MSDELAEDESYQLFEPMRPEEFEALKIDIARNGLLVPIEYDDQGNLIDGHNRKRACDELGIAEPPTIVRTFPDERRKREHILALNLHRRHLSHQKKQRWIWEYEQLLLPVGATIVRPEPKAKTPSSWAPTSAPIAATERQRYHRLKEKIRPDHPVPAHTDPWQLTSDILDKLEALRGMSGVEDALLNEVSEMVKQLAWGPEA